MAEASEKLNSGYSLVTHISHPYYLLLSPTLLSFATCIWLHGYLHRFFQKPKKVFFDGQETDQARFRVKCKNELLQAYNPGRSTQQITQVVYFTSHGNLGVLKGGCWLETGLRLLWHILFSEPNLLLLCMLYHNNEN